MIKIEIKIVFFANISSEIDLKLFHRKSVCTRSSSSSPDPSVQSSLRYKEKDPGHRHRKKQLTKFYEVN